MWPYVIIEKLLQLLSVLIWIECLWFKSSKPIIPGWFYNTSSLIFLLWNSPFGVGGRDSSLSTYGLFALNIIIKDSFSSPVMIFLSHRSFICLERWLVAMDMQSSLFFLLRVWGSQIPSLLTFPIFFSFEAV